MAVTPVSVSASALTNFQVTFTAATTLSGASGATINVVLSSGEDFVTAPASVDLTGGSCIQSANGGATSVAGFSVILLGTCTINAGSSVNIYFSAEAPATVGTFFLNVTTSGSTASVSSNIVTVNTAGAPLTSEYSNFGANSKYTITNGVVTGLAGPTSTITLTAFPTGGSTEALTFYNGPAGYTVTYTPSGGAATSDTVLTAAASGSLVTLTLGTALVNGDTLSLTAQGTNPAPTTLGDQRDYVTITGNGLSLTTTSVTFGDSVLGVTVSPSTTIAGASAVYTVNFQASDALGVGGELIFTETGGETNFSAVNGVDVSDAKQNWNFVATTVVASNGTITIFLNDAIVAGDLITVKLANVTNPAAGTITDFTVATNGEDGVPSYAAPYVIGANGSPGVVVTVNPSGTTQTAQYTISNVYASAALAGGSSTIGIDGPAGTVFPNNQAFYVLQDSTTPAGSGSVSAAVTGGGTNDVVITVPNSINSGDVFTITIQDVFNPSTASSTDSITLVGNVTGPVPVGTTTTTTTVPPTTTTTAPPRPVVKSLTTTAMVVKKAVGLKLSCSGATCVGKITLTDVRTVLAVNGAKKYSLGAGKTGTFSVGLDGKAMALINHAKGHAIAVTETVTVTGGTTITARLTLVG